MRRLLIVLLFSIKLCFAAPTVIYDSGQTQSLMGYLVNIDAERGPRKTAPTQAMPSVYPVITATLNPGIVTPRATKLPQLQQPLFIVGYDSLSFRWLKTFAATLRHNKAVGLVVNVESAQQFEAIKAVAPGLELYPGPGAQLAQEIGLKHYPALISINRIEQ
jgi:integrating conjugative element protein (TIGR03765 family)